jgi:hypothetical protein
MPNPALKSYHASRTPEEKAAWRAKVSQRTTEGMHAWHAGKTEAERQLANQHIAEAARCRIGIPRKGNPGHRWQKGHKPVGNTTPDALARRAQTRIRNASLKQIIKDLVLEEPEEWRDLVRRGRDAENPLQAFPFLSLALQYTDTKANEIEPDRPARNLSELTNEELLQRAIDVASRLQSEVRKQAEIVAGNSLPVIDVTIVKPEEQK